MFSMTPGTDISGLVMPNGPYGGGNEDFLQFRADSASFRLQRLGSYLLSDLFTTGYMEASGFVHQKPLTTLARGKQFYYTGEIFDQWDLDVLMHCARHTKLGSAGARLLRLDPGKLLQSLNLRNDQRNRDKVFTSLYRLHSGQIEIHGERYRYLTRLINRLLLDENQRFCLLEANADLVASLRAGRHASVDIRDRFTLGRNGLAKWMHGALMVFKGGFAADLDCLHRLCGSSAKTIKGFSQSTTRALDNLAKAGMVESWELEKNHVRVAATPAEIQDAACGFINRGACP